jgi:xanthine dehydrogenase accessory factor
MDIFARLAELERTGVEAALATVIRDQGSVPRRAGARMLVFADGHTEGTIGGGEMESRVANEARQVIQERKPRIVPYRFNDPQHGDPGVCGGEIEVFIEPLRARPTLVVAGIGHVGQAVAHLGHWLGFRLVVSDDRAEFAAPGIVPEADQTICCPLEDLPQRMPIDDQTYLVLTTRNVTLDVAGLPSLLKTDFAYLGIIGSRRRWETTVGKLREAGIPEAQIQRVVSPTGLELNAETPEEIALSILAQIILLRRGGSGQSMRQLPVERRTA